MLDSEKHQNQYLADLPVVADNYINLDSRKKLNNNLKRIIDIFLSLLILIFFSPLMIIISLIIKLTSKGEIIFKQERLTKDEKSFFMYKFRTMNTNAELYTGPIFADNNDKRCTKVGLALRKTSLDELPQFFNVLKGDMSIVGPRPERPFYVEKFKKKINNYSRRHLVKSGITGLAQIKGLRGKTSIEERLENDLEYIKNISIFIDIKIIILTIKIILKDICSFFSKNHI
jgi:exopolysaccharide biosynthesis polyprenyl glycosylphosphotransferase